MNVCGKLIQILKDAREFHNYTEWKTAHLVLSEIRCDTCSNWRKFQTDPTLGMCEIDSRRIRVPEFFCAGWESIEVAS